MNDELNKRKSMPLDPYGLTKQGLTSKDAVSYQTPYDCFLLEDSFRFVNYEPQLSTMKKQMENRLNQSTGLYDVTIGDVNSEYYNLATMFNRIVDPVYGAKVYATARLISTTLRNVKSSLRDEMKTEISTATGAISAQNDESFIRK